ncbi:copper amine oxidase N-terminal domain-containing protein [Paenibacillus sp. J5C_2022]|uniref:copper amine oxidase N-terminal domain-containing protein n=1 Tax=Paenibacillus sp. J5C2022 TaxID=2977129 RepID=UPI0021D1A7A1|nr:copper amine oxidase N-terminal domain-containing protein [Paenibacillus sp. J5C2022]MCU6707073.1 copper amine oxidase N-terminal domain-containing protein [Paenibacillus sp. J5C2022]
MLRFEKLARITVWMTLAVCLIGAAIPDVLAKVDDAEVIDVLREESGYRLKMPAYAGMVEVESEDSSRHPLQVEAVELHAPEWDEHGETVLFQLLAQNPEADRVALYVSLYSYGKIDYVESELKDGEMAYKLDKATLAMIGNRLISLQFSVLDQQGEVIFEAHDIHFRFADNAVGAIGDAPVKAKPASSRVLVDGKTVVFEAYTIGGNNYFKLRDVAMALNGSAKRFAVAWDADSASIDLLPGDAYQPVGNELKAGADVAAKRGKPASASLYLDGVQVLAAAYNIEGSNYYKLRDIARAIDFQVGWDADSRTVSLVTKERYSEQ